MFGELQWTANALRWAAEKPPLFSQIRPSSVLARGRQVEPPAKWRPSRTPHAPGVRQALTT
jgi:hypothetical protein